MAPPNYSSNMWQVGICCDQETHICLYEHTPLPLLFWFYRFMSFIRRTAVDRSHRNYISSPTARAHSGT